MSRIVIFWWVLLAPISLFGATDSLYFESALHLFAFVQERPEDSVYMKDVHVGCQSEEWYRANIDTYSAYLDSSGVFVIDKELFLDDVIFETVSEEFFGIYNFNFLRALSITAGDGCKRLGIINSAFQGRCSIKDYNEQTGVLIMGSRFANYFDLITNATNVIVEQNEFTSAGDSISPWASFNMLEHTQFALLQENKFKEQSVRISFDAPGVDLLIKECEFHRKLDLSNNSLAELSVRDSDLFGKISMNRTTFDHYRSYIPTDFFCRKLYLQDLIFDGPIASSNYFDDTSLDFSDDYCAEQFLSVYRNFQEFFEHRGNVSEKNVVTVRFHELNLERKKYELMHDFTLVAAIGYTISSFIGITTEFGTNPIRIILLSLFAVLIFSGVFVYDYLLKRKSHGVQSALTRSDLLELFIISFLNSLNSFTTLGFGELPKRKSAAYIAVVEGFIGWLALTLFSVCLITQFLS